jgi:hypothetical protein
MGLVSVAAVQRRDTADTNTILLTHVICSYTASRRSHSGGTLLSEIRDFPKLYSSMVWLVLLE